MLHATRQTGNETYLDWQITKKYSHLKSNIQLINFSISINKTATRSSKIFFQSKPAYAQQDRHWNHINQIKYPQRSSHRKRSVKIMFLKISHINDCFCPFNRAITNITRKPKKLIFSQLAWNTLTYFWVFDIHCSDQCIISFKTLLDIKMLNSKNRKNHFLHMLRFQC